MDSHIKGPRGGNSYGSVVSAIVALIKFGSPPQSGHDVFRTTGASVANPVIVRGTAIVTTAFDGTAVVKIVHTNLQGGDQQDFILAAAAAPVVKAFTTDRIFQGIYTPGTATTGDVGFMLEALSKGIREVDI